ncbi:sulfite exporter TauE/SafE family protein [Pelomonas sp. KK5]|uniref:sulfite exporter TauE/SafE family protein n=1 Tax=Pelomonas sp. KK5 TaxID=1855730 RepID=UPI00097BAB76|nr:sulfite exporter TauE/SafE family protein [Pelomonas sp. KK5]
MMMNTAELWLPCAAIFVLAGLVKGMSGLGLPTLSMALLSSLVRLPPASAAALMLLPALLTNVAQCLGPHGASLLRRLWPMWLALAAATLWSPLGSAPAQARIVLAVVLIAYGCWGLAKPKLPSFERWPRTAAVVAGAIAGTLGAGTGVFVMPMVPFMQTLRLDKTAQLQAMGISFTVGTAALALRLGSGMPQWPAPGLVAAALVASFAGLALGNRLVGRLSPLWFQRLLYGVFVGLGGLMLVSG